MRAPLAHRTASHWHVFAQKHVDSVREGMHPPKPTAVGGPRKARARPGAYVSTEPSLWQVRPSRISAPAIGGRQHGDLSIRADPSLLLAATVLVPVRDEGLQGYFNDYDPLRPPLSPQRSACSQPSLRPHNTAVSVFRRIVCVPIIGCRLGSMIGWAMTGGACPPRPHEKGTGQLPHCTALKIKLVASSLRLDPVGPWKTHEFSVARTPASLQIIDSHRRLAEATGPSLLKLTAACTLLRLRNSPRLEMVVRRRARRSANGRPRSACTRAERTGKRTAAVRAQLHQLRQPTHWESRRPSLT
uniref:Uncharacterized protein n=1 Tax=Mycena chlorophos TaxID=658473 RepID=A0ABQ0KYC3_MYCCL|nr:predicted protein [Mycena chlorophos]